MAHGKLDQVLCNGLNNLCPTSTSLFIVYTIGGKLQQDERKFTMVVKKNWFRFFIVRFKTGIESSFFGLNSQVLRFHFHHVFGRPFGFFPILQDHSLILLVLNQVAIKEYVLQTLIKVTWLLLTFPSYPSLLSFLLFTYIIS